MRFDSDQRSWLGWMGISGISPPHLENIFCHRRVLAVLLFLVIYEPEVVRLCAVRHLTSDALPG